MEKYISKSEEDTIEFAKNFAKDLKKGDIIVLTGELRFTVKQNLLKGYFLILD